MIGEFKGSRIKIFLLLEHSNQKLCQDFLLKFKLLGKFLANQNARIVRLEYFGDPGVL